MFELRRLIIRVRYQYLLVCDLDGTLLGDDLALRRFSQWLAPQRDRVALAYSSGRLHWSILEAMEQYPLPAPDFVVGGVGTEIRTRAHGEPWAQWSERFASWDEALVRERLHGRFRLRIQPGRVHSPHKVSYFGDDLSPVELAGIEEALQDAGLDVRLIYSSSRDLDVVPAAAGKGEAARYLAEHLDVAATCLIACGDSGNDRCMLEQAGRGVVVANAFAELHDLRRPTVYHSPHRYAAGVQDGVRHWLQELAAGDGERAPAAESA